MGEVRGHRDGFRNDRQRDGGMGGGRLGHAECKGAQTRTGKLVGAPGGGFLRWAGLHGRLRRRVLSVAGGKRLSQKSKGYVATVVSGAVTQRNGEPTGALPGRLVRGVRGAPAAAAKLEHEIA